MPAPLKGSQKYTYDPRLGAGGRYRNAKGRIVKNVVIIRELERVQRGAKREAVELSQKLKNGEISLQEWYDGTRQKLKTIHGLSGAIARGGWERMSQSDWGRVGFVSKVQYQFLNNFAKQLEAGIQKLDGRFLRRVKMYVDAGKSTYFEVRRGAARQTGFVLERRRLGVAEHCRSRGGLLGCVELANLGWQTIGTLPRIGESPCLSNCKCHFEFRKSLLGREPIANRVTRGLRSIMGRVVISRGRL